MAALIEAVGLAKAYGTTTAVEGVSFTVARGELFVLMGLSGSGKSTVLRMLNGLIAPTAGTVNLEGRDIAHLRPEELREVRNRRMSMVFQSFGLFPTGPSATTRATACAFAGRRGRRSASAPTGRSRPSGWEGGPSGIRPSSPAG
jgi:glycine betaine/proline transport system ATP-binding protein